MSVEMIAVNERYLQAVSHQQGKVAIREKSAR